MKVRQEVFEGSSYRVCTIATRYSLAHVFAGGCVIV